MIPPYTVNPDLKFRYTRDEAWKMFLEGKGTVEDPGMWHRYYHMSHDRLAAFVARNTDWPPGFEVVRLGYDEEPRALALHGAAEHGMMKVPGIHDGGAFYAIAQAIPRSWRISLLGNLWGPYSMRHGQTYGCGKRQKFHGITAGTLHTWLITEWVGLWQRVDREDVSGLDAEGLFGFDHRYWGLFWKPEGVDQAHADMVGRQFAYKMLERQPRGDQMLWGGPRSHWSLGQMVVKKSLVYENTAALDLFVREQGLHHRVIEILGIRGQDLGNVWDRIPENTMKRKNRWVAHRIDDRSVEARSEVAATALIAREYARVVVGRGWAHDDPRAVALLKAVDLVAITGFCYLLARRMKMGTSWIFPPEDAPVVPGWDPLGMDTKKASLEKVAAAP